MVIKSQTRPCHSQGTSLMCIWQYCRLSAASHDPYNEDMRVELLPYDLQFQMFKILSIETEDEKGKDRLLLKSLNIYLGPIS